MNARPLARRALPAGLSRRTIIRRFGVGGAVAGVLGTIGRVQTLAAQESTPATPAGWQSHHLEVDFTLHDPVSITQAGGGPPQRGDTFHISGPIFAAGDVGGTEIGTYQCFGIWTHASDAQDVPNLRLTTTWFHMEDGSIAGLINEGGANHNELVGAVHGGTGRYTAALGSFRQPILPPEEEVTEEGATPVVAQVVVRAVFDLLLPQTEGGA